MTEPARDHLVTKNNRRTRRIGQIPTDNAEIHPHITNGVMTFLRATLFSKWSWKIDGRLSLYIFATLIYIRIGPQGFIKEWSSVFAILCVGYILKRNLRRDVSWRELSRAIKNRREQ